jgi:hypothetical protein
MAQRFGIISLERAVTFLAAVGFDRDHSMDEFRRHKIAFVLRVFGLAAGLTAGGNMRNSGRS